VGSDGRQPQQRADARRNRDKLLSVAVAAFSEPDDEVTLETIAKRAGVGIGTLYRHFPTREELVAAAYRHEVERLCDAVEQLQQEMPPDAALREWMERFVDYVAAKKGMAAALQSVVTADSRLFADTYAQIVAALTALLRAGIDAGTIRPDVDAEDVLRAMRGAWLVTDQQHRHDHARRLLDLLMDGLRFGAGNSKAR
jgi:AcrR family transcriptional regulator